jgi:hypothetical protein
MPTSIISAGNAGNLGIQAFGGDDGNLTLRAGQAGAQADVIMINTSGFTPGTNNTFDLGTAALRWRNIYTNDLQLSNGIGDYTIVEGEEDLFLYNNKNGKTYKFAIIEVDPSVVPNKARHD